MLFSCPTIVSHSCPTSFGRVIVWFTPLQLYHHSLAIFSMTVSPIILTHPVLFSSRVTIPSSSSLAAFKESHCHCVYCLSVKPRPMSLQASCSIPLFVVIPFIFFPVIVHSFVVSELIECCGKFPSNRSLDHSLHSWRVSQHYQWSGQMRRRL